MVISRCAAAVLMAAAVVTATPASAQQGSRFGDVPADAYYSVPVSELDRLGVFDGTLCGGGSGFCPDTAIDRKTMAVWIVRILDGQDPAPVTAIRFDDVDADGFHAAFIERMADLGVTRGCGDGSGFCPDEAVSRAHMAAFLSRAYELPDGPVTDFSDVPEDAWYAADVARLTASRITVGCKDGSVFCPDRDTTRAQMATFLARAEGLVTTPTPTESDTTQAHTYSAVHTGALNTCGLRTNDTITCWGGNSSGQTDAPSGTFKALALGQHHTCGLRTNDTITCWGDNSSGQTDAPSGTFKAVTAGFVHTCGLRTDDTITCWGWWSLEQTDAPSGTFKSITASDWGISHTCGLRTDNTITCWGNNLAGQTDAPSGTFKAVTTGDVNTCGLRTDDTITCWGDNNSGQTDAPSGTFKSITTGGVHTCGLRTDNTITCWGVSDYAPRGPFKAVDAVSGCGLRTDNTITCWGGNHDHRLAAPRGTYSAVTGSSHHICGLRTDSTVTCWGGNDSGQADPPGAPLGSEQCGMSPSGRAACWGADYYRLEADGVADNNPGVFLTRENEVSRFIKHEVVDKHADGNPWLMEVWNHTNRPDFQYLQTSSISHVSNADYRAGSFKFRAASLQLNDFLDLNIRAVPTAVHEMAHVYTLTSDVSDRPAPIAIAHLYFAHQYDRPDIDRPAIGFCIASEMYADAAVRLVTANLGPYYWQACTAAPVFVTEEAVDVVRSAFSGEMPQWLYETFSRADGSLDYEAIWSVVQGLYRRPSPDPRKWLFRDTAIVVIQLKDAFGGYCSDLHTVLESALGRSTLAQPWRDGDCP